MTAYVTHLLREDVYVTAYVTHLLRADVYVTHLLREHVYVTHDPPIEGRCVCDCVCDPPIEGTCVLLRQDVYVTAYVMCM